MGLRRRMDVSISPEGSQSLSSVDLHSPPSVVVPIRESLSDLSLR